MSDQAVGNSDAGRDLYGLGVRLGFYFQAAGMTLSLLSESKSRGKGLKIGSGSMTVAFLVCWFNFAALREFSPSEAVVVLCIILILSFPAKTSLTNPETIDGELTGLALILLVELGTCAAFLWLFGVLVNSLPPRGTPGMIFLIAWPVAINGPFRYVALLYFIFDAGTSLSFAWKVLRIFELMRSWYKMGDSSSGRNAADSTLAAPPSGDIAGQADPSADSHQVGPEAAGPSQIVQNPTDPPDSTSPPIESSPPSPGHHQSGPGLSHAVLVKKIDEIMEWNGQEPWIKVLRCLSFILLIITIEFTVNTNQLRPVNALQEPGQLIPLLVGIVIMVDGAAALVSHPGSVWHRPLNPNAQSGYDPRGRSAFGWSLPEPRTWLHKIFNSRAGRLRDEESGGVTNLQGIPMSHIPPTANGSPSGTPASP